MTYGSNCKGKRARVRYFWRTYIQVSREPPRFAASEVSVAQVFSFNFRRCSGGLRRSFFRQASARPFSGLPTTTTEDAQTWLAGCVPQVFERIRLVEISSRREGGVSEVRIRNCVGMALARRLSVSVKAEIPGRVWNRKCGWSWLFTAWSSLAARACWSSARSSSCSRTRVKYRYTCEPATVTK